MNIPETRGRKPQKIKILAGDIKKINPKQAQAFRYHAKKNGWKISIRQINGKLLVFRKS
jgi:hypothetical protein